MGKAVKIGAVIVVLVLLIVGYLFLTGQIPGIPGAGNAVALTSEQKSVSALLKANDLNFSDFKIAVELFSYTLPEEKINSLLSSASASPETKQLLLFEKKQNAIMMRLDALASKDLVELCMDLNSGTKIQEDAILLVDEVDVYLQSQNSFGIDSLTLLNSYYNIEKTIDDYSTLCLATLEEIGVFE